MRRKLKRKLAKIQQRKNNISFIELIIFKKKILPNYINNLKHNISKCIDLRYAEVSLGDWQPSPKKCHDNVSIWCQHNPEYKSIRGWLYFDLIGRFVAHSVVKAPDGYFYDITPTDNLVMGTYPFIPTQEPFKEFMAIVKASNGALDI